MCDHCRRSPQAGADWNLRRWLVRPPSSFRSSAAGAASSGEGGEELVTAAPNNGLPSSSVPIPSEVVSLLLVGHTRAVPFPPGFAARGRRAFDGARAGVARALDCPLEV